MNWDEIIALRQAFDSVKQRQQKNLPKNFPEMTKRVKASRESAVGNEDLLKNSLNALDKNGIRICRARDAKEAVQKILEEIGKERLVVKSKSNVTKEMSKPHRIAAGGLIFKEDAILLVRYCDENGGTYLVGPGGALKDHENVIQSIMREALEETGVTVKPERVVIIEDLLCSQFKMSKVWMTCHVVEGDVCRTKGAEKEGIIEAAWFTKAQLAGEVVFPPPLNQHDWNQLRSENWRVECLPSRKAGF